MALPAPIEPENALILTQLAVRWHRLFLQRKADQEALTEIQARLAAAHADLEKLKRAAIALGAEPAKLGWFVPIREAVGVEVFDKAMADAGLVVQWKAHALQTVLPPAVTKESPPPLSPAASIRDLVIERLEAAGAVGALASDIRKYIEALRGTELHEKTVGMTLYRLSRDGLARREGRTWFFVPEAKNPGSGVPGQQNIFE
jgi:hypothetical protein